MNGRRIPLAPSEGWLTLGLVLLLCLTMAWAIDDVALVLGEGAFTDFLAPMAVLGVLCSFIGVKVGWGRWLTYLVGALFAALVVPIVVGSMLPTKVDTLSAWFVATAASAAKAFNELVVQNNRLTQEYGHYMLALGLVVWGTSMFASYATFGHRRPLNAIVIVGLVLLINMSVTYADQLVYLVLFSIASLLLLVRYHVLDEQTEWLRRRIGDPASISGIYLRGGTVFIAVAVVASLLLTNIARSAPLEGSWGPLAGTFLDLSRSISKFVPTGGATKAFGSDFDPMSTGIHGKWQPNTAIVAIIKLPLDAPKLIYWRAVTYDQFLLNEWRPSPVTKTQVGAGNQLLQGTAENQLLASTSELTFSVQPMQDTGRTVLSPATPVVVDKDADVTFVGQTGNLDAVERREGGPYTVLARIRLPGNDQGELNAAALRSAGTDYPDDIAALYLDVPDDAMQAGGPAEQLFEQLVADAPNPDNPYDFASYLQQQFVKAPKDGGIFTYDTDVTDLVVGPCKDISTVDCFAQYRRGFCQYYATTMAIFLRAQGIPARIAEGYLPGNRVQGQETVRGDSRHQWVEAYFPYYGWVMFDPTGGVSVQQPLPPGPAGASTPPLPSAAFAIPSFRDPRDQEPNDIGRGGKTPGPPIASFIAIAVLLAVIVGALAFYVWTRGPRGGTTAEHAYRTVTRIAARFGFGPRPNQTVYEYAGSLGEVLPIARPELEMVARAKVETAYGRFRLEDDRIQALRAAERKLRLNLLRLAFRRRERRRRR